MKRPLRIAAIVLGVLVVLIIAEIVGDLRRAIRFIRFHASEYGVEPERLALLGESAGAALALLLGTSSDVGIPKPTDPYPSSAIEEFEGVSGRVAAVISLVGGGGEFPSYTFFAQQPGFKALPTEAKNYYRGLIDVKDEQRRELSPNTYLSSDDPPTLLINGDNDEMIPISAPESTYQALLKAGVKSKFVKLAGAGHGYFKKEDADQVHTETLNWLKEHLKVK